MAPTPTSPTRKYLHDLYTPRARELTAPIFGPSPQGHATPLNLTYGLADPVLFPTTALAQATAEVLAQSTDAALNYGPPSAELTEQLVVRLRAQGIEAEHDQVMLSYGSSQILALLPEVLVNRGDVILIEGPSFMGAVRRFELAGAQLVSIPTDAQGMDVEVLEHHLAAFAQQGIRPKFIYTIPTFHNPTGASLSLERRQRLVALAAHYGVLIVEDDAYYDLRFGGEPLPTLAELDGEGWVLRVGTYSKILAPGVRVGWAYGPRELIQRLIMFKPEGEHGPFVTHVVARYCAEGQLDAHIAELRARYRSKCQVVLDAIAKSFPEDVVTHAPEGGFFIWCKLPQGLSASALVPLAAERGVAFLPGTRCFANGQGDDAIRLAFSYLAPEELAEGITRLGEAMRVLRG